MIKSSELLCSDKQELFKNISLSANTITERITAIDSDLRMQLKENISNFAAFLIAIDESIEITVVIQFFGFYLVSLINLK